MGYIPWLIGTIVAMEIEVGSWRANAHLLTLALWACTTSHLTVQLRAYTACKQFLIVHPIFSQDFLLDVLYTSPTDLPTIGSAVCAWGCLFHSVCPFPS